MPLNGSLGHLGLADLLQTGLAGRTGGYLTLRRGAEHAVLYVGDEGLHLLTPDPLDAIDVITAFVRRGRAPETALQKLGEPKDALLRLDELISQGQLPESELLELLAGTAEDSILDLLTWDDGTFRFDERPLDPRHVGLVGRIGVDPGGVMLRAAQRMDERSAIARDLGMSACLFVALPADEIPVEEPDDPAPQVHQLLDGRTLVQEAALLLGIGRFTALKSVHALVRAGAARGAHPGELAALSQARLSTGQLGSARALALHWAGLEAINHEPLELLVEVARGRGRFDDEMAARCALGNLLLHTSRPEEALRAFQGALDRSPTNEDALAGTRLAAQAVGDDRAYARASMTLAQSALGGGDEDRAARLADDLVSSDPGNIESHMLRARAYAKLKNRDAFVESAEAVAQLLGGRARRKQDREAATYFRDSLSRIAPDRSDLLRRFRGITEGNTKGMRRVAMLVAFLGVLATAGIVLWPTSPATLLADAQAAFERGETTRAQEIVAQLIEEFPDSAEAENAFQLQTRMLYPQANQPKAVPTPTPATTQPGKAGEKGPSEVEEIGPLLAALPDRKAQARLTELVEALAEPVASARRKRVFQVHGEALPGVARRLQRDARERQDVLAQSKTASHRLDGDMPAMTSYLEDLGRARDMRHVENLERALEVLQRLASLQELDVFRSALRGFKESTERLRRGLTTYAHAFVLCEQTMARMEVDHLFDRCTKEAPALLVSGRLDEADELYAELAELVSRVRADETLEPVTKRIDRLRIDRFLSERREIIQGIYRDLEAARAAEAQDDLDAASQIYAGLVKRHWQIRFENVFTLPLRVTSVPAGADVLVNGKPAGATPVIVRYPWGSQTNVLVRSKGYDKKTVVVEGSGAEPPSRLDVRLEPKTVWSAEMDSASEAHPVAVGDDVLVVDRSGRVTLYDGKRGGVVWGRHYRSLEGVRAAPIVLDGDIVLAYVDGRVLFLDRRDGSIRSEARTGRPVGDLAVSQGVGALVTLDGELVTLRAGRVDRRVALGVHATAGVLAAHGAFWVGAGEGVVVRVDPRTLAARKLTFGGGRAAVAGLATTKNGVLVSSSSGRLASLDTTGRRRWMKDGLGDLVGRPAAAGGVAAVADRRGRVLLFALADGAPRGAKDLRSEPKDGLRMMGGSLLAALKDGRLWAFDAAGDHVRVDAPVNDGAPRFAPTPIGKGRVAVSAKDGRLAISTLP